MANPQRENGHIDIANEIVEALAQYRISGTEWQVLWVILRHTWGWHRKDEFISYGVIAEKTGMRRRNVIRAVQSLTEKNILIKNGDNLVNNLKINKDYESWKGWKVVSKMTPVSSVKNDTRGSVKNDTRGSVKNDTSSIYVLKKDKESIKEKKIYKEKKETKKRYLDFVFLTEIEFQKLVEKLGNEKTNEMIEQLNYYIGSTGKRYKNHYFTILQWVASDKRKQANITDRRNDEKTEDNRFRSIRKIRASDFM